VKNHASDPFSLAIVVGVSFFLGWGLTPRPVLIFPFGTKYLIFSVVLF